MPFRIDAFKGSPAVQAMHPAARMGYLYLLSYAWQTEDCTVPSDQLELAENSGLGDELWVIHGPRIMRKFESVNGNGRLRNQVCFEEWTEAKRVFEARRKSADRTNSLRSPSEVSTVTVDGPLRSADTRTTVVPVPVGVPVFVGEKPFPEEPEKPIDPCMFASAVLVECRIGGRNLRMVLEEVGRAEQIHGEDLEALAAQAVRSWNEYCAVKSQLDHPCGAEKFFGEGIWKHPENWPRKKKSRAETIAAWRAPPDEED
jgi:hypothetical protein